MSSTNMSSPRGKGKIGARLHAPLHRCRCTSGNISPSELTCTGSDCVATPCTRATISASVAFVKVRRTAAETSIEMHGLAAKCLLIFSHYHMLHATYLAGTDWHRKNSQHFSFASCRCNRAGSSSTAAVILLLNFADEDMTSYVPECVCARAALSRV